MKIYITVTELWRVQDYFAILKWQNYGNQEIGNNHSVWTAFFYLIYHEDILKIVNGQMDSAMP